MANLTFSSPLLHRDKTVYAVAGDTRTILMLAEAHKIPIPFECRDGECGSCLVEVEYLSLKPKMAISLTEHEKTTLKALKKLTAEEIVDAEVNDMPPRFRLACQYIARDEEVKIKFTGEPGGGGELRTTTTESGSSSET